MAENNNTGFSEKLNGYWEEGYHFYIEIRNEKITIREYRRKVQLETTISYDAESAEKGLKTPVTMKETVLSVGGSNNPMSWFEEMYYEDGLLKVVEGYSFMDRKDPYTLKKVDHGPFDHIVIRDEEYLPKLQGVWKQWTESGTGGYDLVIEDNTFKWKFCSGKFHVISYNKPGYDRNIVRLTPYDLTEDSFLGCCSFDVYPDMLTTHETVFDMIVPMSVFAREENLNKIEVPAGAKGCARPAMGPAALENLGPMGMGMLVENMSGLMEEQQKNLENTLKITVSSQDNKTEKEKPDVPEPVFIPVEKEGDDPYRLKEAYTCPDCGTVFEDSLPAFCWNCGGILRKRS